MRIGAYLFVVLALAGAAAAQDVIRTPLPDGGLQVIQPGYSYRTPGAGWTMTGSLKPENGVVRGWEHFGVWVFEKGRGGPVLRVSLINFQSRWFPSADALEKYLRDNTGGPVVATTINGAPCATVRQHHDMRRRVSDPIGKSIEYWQVCSHPEMAGLAVEMRYETEPVGGPDPVDAELQQVTASLAFAPLPYRVREFRPGCAVNDVVAAAGALWMTCSVSGERLEERDKVLRIDPATNTVTAEVPVGRNPNGIVEAEGSLWVVNAFDNTISRIDPRTAAVTATVGVPAGPFRLIPSSGYLWGDTGLMGDRGSIFRIDPKTGVVDKGIRIDGDYLLEGAGSRLLLRPIRGKEQLLLDGVSGAVVGRLPERPLIQPLRFDGRYLWLANHDRPQTEILRLDLDTPDAPFEFVRTVPGEAHDIAWWNGETCVASMQAVLCLPPDGTTVHEVPMPVPLSGELTVFAGSLWVSGWNSGVLLRIDPM